MGINNFVLVFCGFSLVFGEFITIFWIIVTVVPWLFVGLVCSLFNEEVSIFLIFSHDKERFQTNGYISEGKAVQTYCTTKIVDVSSTFRKWKHLNNLRDNWASAFKFRFLSKANIPDTEIFLLFEFVLLSRQN